jgi:hypothetical protein
LKQTVSFKPDVFTVDEYLRMFPNSSVNHVDVLRSEIQAHIPLSL